MYFTNRCNMQEIILYPFIFDKYIKAIEQDNLEKKGYIELSAPPSHEQRFLRKSLLPRYINECSR